MKWLLYLVLIGLVAGSWVMFSQKGNEMKTLQNEITLMEEKGDPDEKLPEMETRLGSLEGERTFSGILLTFLSAGVVGIFFVVYLLPFFAHRVTHAVYDSAEMIEKDVMHDARSLVAQGDYQGAIAAFKLAAEADPLNRLPHVEIAKIYKDNLGNPAAAIETFRHALESQEWEIRDAAFFLFRLAEMYDELANDRDTAKSIMQQVVDQFPNTRHSANANHKLHEWSLEEASAGPDGETAEEREYLAKMRAAEQAAAQAKGGPTRYELPSMEDEGSDRNA